MQDWELALESLLRQGWGYGYGKCHDSETGREIYLVNLGRGNKRLSIFKPTLEEAVIAVRALVQEIA